MRRSFIALCTALCLSPVAAFAAPVIGEPAPAFDLTDANGQEVSIDALQGKPIVLEWVNFGCPFVKKYYDSGNMQKIQKQAATNGTVWISVFSSAKGEQGYVTAQEAINEMKKRDAAPAHIITDPDGTLGRLYDAKVTPHMYVIDKDGTLAYMGAIDDKPTADKADIEGARNYVVAALASLRAGAPVSPSTTKPYGCGVKYAQ